MDNEPLQPSANPDPVGAESENLKRFIAKLKTLGAQEHQLYHWYVTSGCSWKQCVRELRLRNRDHFDWLCSEISKKLGTSVVQLRKLRDQDRSDQLRNRVHPHPFEVGLAAPGNPCIHCGLPFRHPIHKALNEQKAA